MSYIVCKLDQSGHLFYKRKVDGAWAMCHDGVLSQVPFELDSLGKTTLYREDELFGIKKEARIVSLLFSEGQLAAGIHERLNIYQGCYGMIEPRNFRTGRSLR